MAKKEINLRVLKRHDKTIDDIILTCAHAVLYDYSGTAWLKARVEGTLFVVASLGVHRIIVLNRLGLDNLDVELMAELQLQALGDYTVFRREGTVHGLWIFDMEERATLSLVVEAIVAQAAELSAADESIGRHLDSRSGGQMHRGHDDHRQHEHSHHHHEQQQHGQRVDIEVERQKHLHQQNQHHQQQLASVCFILISTNWVTLSICMRE